jgi:hypothetical protein
MMLLTGGLGGAGFVRKMKTANAIPAQKNKPSPVSKSHWSNLKMLNELSPALDEVSSGSGAEYSSITVVRLTI